VTGPVSPQASCVSHAKLGHILVASDASHEANLLVILGMRKRQYLDAHFAAAARYFMGCDRRVQRSCILILRNDDTGEEAGILQPSYLENLHVTDPFPLASRSGGDGVSVGHVLASSDANGQRFLLRVQLHQEVAARDILQFQARLRKRRVLFRLWKATSSRRCIAPAIAAKVSKLSTATVLGMRTNYFRHLPYAAAVPLSQVAEATFARKPTTTHTSAVST